MPLPIQAKVLRLLQERQFERVGGLQMITVDLRVVAATHRDLKQAVAERAFREDLFYRLSVFPVEIPPLRRRRGDVLPLAEAFLQRHAHELGRRGLRLSEAARARLLAHTWPGNVRELQNCMERAAILCDGEVRPEHLRLPDDESAPPSLAGVLDLSGPLDGVVKRAAEAAEAEAIRLALAEARNDHAAAAERLAITPRALARRITALGLG
jgi:DNA-binding NtrC family response regulator